MKTRLLAIVLALVFLTGCASVLEREYSTVEPHSSKLWESEAADTLRAENYQDLVNDLLILVGRHKETATIRLYNVEDELTVTETVEQAMGEVQQETPLGSYAVEYIAFASQAQRSYYEISFQIGYRRTAEQIQSVMNATSAEAVYSLLETALNAERTELAVRVSYWNPDGQETVNETVARLREKHGLTAAPEWLVRYYPANGITGLVEILMEPTAEDFAEAEQALQKEQPGEEPDDTVEEEAAEPKEAVAAGTGEASQK